MSIKKNNLNLHILVGRSGLNDPMKISKEITSESHGLRREYEIVLDERNNLEYVMSLLRQAYEQN
jgi:predicted transport protein